MDIIAIQAVSTRLVSKEGNIKKIFVDGGFGKNTIYMRLLSAIFPGVEVYAASVAQAREDFQCFTVCVVRGRLIPLFTVDGTQVGE